jgi:hypothetical protein
MGVCIYQILPSLFSISYANYISVQPCEEKAPQGILMYSNGTRPEVKVIENLSVYT